MISNLVQTGFNFFKLSLSRNFSLPTVGDEMKDIFNFLQVSDRIATSGQPTVAQFASIANAGYRVVVNLALPTSTNALPDEAAIVAAQGMQYVSIPVSWEQPTLHDVEQFFSIMAANAHQPVFVHCAANMRVSAFMYLYRRIHDRLSDADAQPDLQRIWVPNATWQTFIQQVLEHYSAIT